MEQSVPESPANIPAGTAANEKSTKVGTCNSLKDPLHQLSSKTNYMCSAGSKTRNRCIVSTPELEKSIGPGNIGLRVTAAAAPAIKASTQVLPTRRNMT